MIESEVAGKNIYHKITIKYDSIATFKIKLCAWHYSYDIFLEKMIIS